MVEAQSKMSDSVNPDDYPLALSSIPFLCNQEIWLALQFTHKNWIAAVANIPSETRSRISRFRAMHGYDNIPFSHRPYEYWTDYATTAQRSISMSGDQRLAFDAFDTACLAAKASTLNRIDAGEIEVIARTSTVPTTWFNVETEWLLNGDFKFVFPFHHIHRRDQSIGKNRQNVTHQVRLRDKVGVSIDQSLFAYGERSLASELDFLWRGGAPHQATAGCRWSELYQRLEDGILDQLKCSKLLAFDDGVMMPAKFWQDANRSMPLADWKPGALIRSVITGENIILSYEDAGAPPGKKGRPSLRTEIMDWFKDDYFQRDGTLLNGMEQIEVARELLKRKNKICPEKEPDREETISGWIGKFRKEWRSSREASDGPTNL